MDIIHDQTEKCRRFRILAILDLFSRECLSIEADYSLRSDHVLKNLESLKQRGFRPTVITVDNGSEFISRKVDSWAYANGINVDFITPGKPTQNAFIEI